MMVSATAAPRTPPRRRATRYRLPSSGRPRRFDYTGAAMMLAVIPSLPRAELARLTERMIDRMDQIDGDPDLENLREDYEDNHDREQEIPYA